MADYVAILKKTIDGLGSPSPEMRKRVYEKARVSISSKIAAIQPPPPQAAIDKQMAILEKAIADVEADYELADISKSIDSDLGNAAKPLKADPPPPGPPPLSTAAHKPSNPAAETLAGSSVLTGDRKLPFSIPQNEDRLATPQPVAKSGGSSRAVPALVALALLAGAGYGGYVYRDRLQQAWANLKIGGEQAAPSTPAAETPPAKPTTAAPPESKPAETAAQTPAEPAAEITPTPATPAEPAPATAGAAPKPADPKLTQRLLPDGSEVDEGRAAGAAGVGEGTSVAAATQAPSAELATPPAGETTAPANSIPVGQKAIFYEEGTAAAQGSALPGSVVWSAVKESPGSDLPPEPAIQAEITIPENELTLRMTLRRNADKTLPATHIIELVFVTPEGFAGGSIDQVQRVTFKSTEQAPGNPLVALPAKIADGFFLVALTDAASALETNLTLLRREPWIDIPVTYKTGRRALITMEKGIPGDKVFDEVLKAWDAANTSSGATNNNG
jgi:hypothetical protein